MAKKKKILFAAVDIGWRIEHYSKYIKQNFDDQLRAESFVNYFVPHEHYDTSYTYAYRFDKMNALKRWFLSVFNLCRFLFRYDVFHFFSGETLLTRKTRRFEFWLYRLFGKRIVMHFVGSDIRNPEYVYEKAERIVETLDKGNFKIALKHWQKNLIRDSQDFAHTTFVSTPDLLSIYGTKGTYVPVFLDFDKFEAELNAINVQRDSSRIKILHAPSNPYIKGSQYVEDAFRELKEEGIEGVEFILPDYSNYGVGKYALNRYELFEQMKESDIVIDQLIIGWYGLQAIEGIMCDNIVLSYLDKEYLSYVDGDCPIINTNAKNIKQQIVRSIELIRTNSYNFDSAKKWVKQKHDMNSYENEFRKAWLV
ncbi:MAG: hypothetical protein AAF487_09110 [Bacteroidota bacterium]